MLKILAASALALGMATSAFAQSASDPSTSQNGGSPDTLKPHANETMQKAPNTDSTMTNSTTNGNPSGAMSGSSAADQNAKCPAGTPGAGVKGMPSGDNVAKNPNCQ